MHFRGAYLTKAFFLRVSFLKIPKRKKKRKIPQQISMALLLSLLCPSPLLSPPPNSTMRFKTRASFSSPSSSGSSNIKKPEVVVTREKGKNSKLIHALVPSSPLILLLNCNLYAFDLPFWFELALMQQNRSLKISFCLFLSLFFPPFRKMALCIIFFKNKSGCSSVGAQCDQGFMWLWSVLDGLCHLMDIWWLKSVVIFVH